MIAAVATPDVAWWALVPLIILAGAGFLLLTMASLVRRLPAVLAPAWTVAAGVSVLVYLVPMWSRVGSDGAGSFLAGAVGVDASSVFVTGILAAAMVAAALIAHDYLSREDLPGVEFYVLLLLSAAGGVVMASANDLIVLFLGLEVLSIAVYVLAAMHLRRIESQEAGLKYFLLGAFSSAFLLYGIALVYGATGSTNMARISAYLAHTVLIDDAMLLAGLGLLLVGLGFKVAVVPFHAWTPDVYQGAPTPVVAWMAAGVKAAGFAALMRVFVLTFGTHVSDWRPAFQVVAAATVLVGAIVAVVQIDVKRMLAYSSIVHAGFILVGLQATTDRGNSSVLAYLAVYALLTVGSFGVVTVVGGTGDSSHGLDSYRGLGRRRPFLAGTFTVLLLGQAGIPFTGGFVVKLGVLAAAVDMGTYWLAGVAMLAAAVAAFVYLRVLVAMYLKEAPTGSEVPGVVPVGALVVIIVSAATVLLAGLVPGPLLDLARDAVPVLVVG
ncbi:MAG: NADH-quinone oxidoreductase subunit N [Acidimicrobiales bacterium]|jgi:NADH-quinone oxidoreductase subunit N|nr:NADH-quinone oxidoreductase subunit N [Acidimicrobiales bacterium]HJM26779.1 NADH-quinone oxidoreductase subunit N [Acidimicrobiales bacterium]|tara:strand:- start:531 stop:2015 length:1485 start_codon:yes stop_codon:yes gene_type:complete